MRLFVPLDPVEWRALADLADAERRRPQEQAALMLSRALAEQRRESEQRETAPAERAR